jgi:hypothetical protein
VGISTLSIGFFSPAGCSSPVGLRLGELPQIKRALQIRGEPTRRHLPPPLPSPSSPDCRRRHPGLLESLGELLYPPQRHCVLHHWTATATTSGFATETGLACRHLGMAEKKLRSSSCTKRQCSRLGGSDCSRGRSPVEHHRKHAASTSIKSCWSPSCVNLCPASFSSTQLQGSPGYFYLVLLDFLPPPSSRSSKHGQPRSQGL